MSLINNVEMQRLKELTARVEEFNTEPKQELTCFWKWCLIGTFHTLCMPCTILSNLYKLIKFVLNNYL